jgi:hypothetical protein
VGDRRGAYRVLVRGGDPRKGDSREDLSIVGRIIIRWIFRKWDVGA